MSRVIWEEGTHGRAHDHRRYVPVRCVSSTLIRTVLRARLAVHRPVAEITRTHLRWRRPDETLFHSVRLEDIVALHWSESRLLLIDRMGAPHDVPLNEMHFKEGSFAVNALRSELDRLTAPLTRPA